MVYKAKMLNLVPVYNSDLKVIFFSQQALQYCTHVLYREHQPQIGSSDSTHVWHEEYCSQIPDVITGYFAT